LTKVHPPSSDSSAVKPNDPDAHFAHLAQGLSGESSGSNDLAPTATIRLSQSIAISSLIALIVLSILWELWLAPIRPGGSWLCLKALPLCIPLTGLLKNRLYTYRWLSLWIWFYFTEGVVRVWSDTYPSKIYAAIEVIICFILFWACAMHVRYRFQNAREQADQIKKI